MALLQEVGRAYVALAHYDCKKAVQLFSALPLQHLNTGWVRCQIGRAYYEIAEYQKVGSLCYIYKCRCNPVCLRCLKHVQELEW